MKKFLKTIVLVPMWPLIWMQIGFDLNFDKCNDRASGCWTCGEANGKCCRRAKAMVTWWQA